MLNDQKEKVETNLTGTLDEPDAMYGLLAESVEYPENREWIIFHMRPEATFRDGTPVTAEDVVFSFNVLVEKGLPALRVQFNDIQKAEALDEAAEERRPHHRHR